MGDYANVRQVVGRANEALKPPPRLTLSEWADEYFYLSAESAAVPGRWKTFPYQKAIMDALTDPTVERVTWMKSARVGYALALDTPIATPLGWSTMGGLREGDIVFDEGGKPCRVVLKSAVFTDHDCYRVRFCDGSSIIADADHRWAVESDVALEYLRGERGSGHIGRPKPGEVASLTGLMSTAEMAGATKRRSRAAIAIRNAAALDTPPAMLPVPPYTLGLWLGDGHMVAPRITQHRSDVETAMYIEREGIRVTVGYPDKRHPNNATFWLDCPGGKSNPSPWAIELRRLGVLSNKHVPAAYLRASRAQRLELLRGLMDSDGTIGRDGRAEFSNTNERLANAVYELVVSLGMKASLRGRSPQRENCLPQFRVNFKPTPNANPFHITRKAARVLPPEKPTITYRRRIVSVESVPPVPVQCIEVDSKSSLFLAGSQMVPTHNTKCVNAAIGYYMHQDPSSILFVQPTESDAQGYSKEEIAPMLRDCPALCKIMLDEPEIKNGPKDSGNTILHKKFPGGVISMVGANSGAGFRRISRRVIIFDEVDGYPPSAGSDGDPVSLGIKRSEMFWNRKIFAGSTPLNKGKSRIEQLFIEGDQRRYYVPCPECGHMAPLIFRGEGGHTMSWPEGKPDEAFFACEDKGCVIEHKSKRQMIERGEWRAATEPKILPNGRLHVSFHLWSAYSPSPNATWADLARAFLTAKALGPEKLKTFINTELGETWQEEGDVPDYEKLMGRRESYAVDEVPEGVRFLTCGVDVQKTYFVYEVVGWGLDKESWSIDAGHIEGNPEKEEDMAKLNELLNRVYGGKPISMLGIDSGNWTQHVYAWARQHPMSRVIATKGIHTARTLIGSPSPVDITLRGKKIKNGYKVWPIGPDVGKKEIYGNLGLRRSEEGFPSGYCHFPDRYEEEFFKELTGEQLVSVKNKRTGFSIYEWQLIPGRQNHQLDARVIARACAALLGLDRLVRLPPAPVVVSAPPAAVAPPAPAQSRPDSRFFGRRGKGWLR